jgi:hypothetical protein
MPEASRLVAGVSGEERARPPDCVERNAPRQGCQHRSIFESTSGKVDRWHSSGVHAVNIVSGGHPRPSDDTPATCFDASPASEGIPAERPFNCKKRYQTAHHGAPLRSVRNRIPQSAIRNPQSGGRWAPEESPRFAGPSRLSRGSTVPWFSPRQLALFSGHLASCSLHLASRSGPPCIDFRAI